MKREMALAVALALSSTLAIAADKSDRDSTKTDATEQLKPGQEITSPGAGSGSKDLGTSDRGAAGPAGPSSGAAASGEKADKGDQAADQKKPR